ncbi:hypothetical protein GCM10011583_14700 [Streptomyces camponoticapitis]|uniref:DNA primase n=1 Tax=Streptomyces camponoticapitis TaxID=1616125 RepID=A0ABQ2E4S9_9ACTN|nr:hypothetical protein [Streptomyces camponoticapitis]GGJ84119.1 hypothetical protein GCM10011583_14700 [Streptomyces camponoticapitis]
MTGNAKIGVALVGGYLLGRTKKAKLAIGFGMFLAGKKLSFDPKQLGKLVSNSPVLGTLNDQVRKELVGATKTAATNALTQRASGLADSLHRRTLELDGKEEAAEEREDDEPEDSEPEDSDPEDRDQEDHERDSEPDEKPAPRRKTAAKAPAKSAGRSASKATSGARRTASGGARKKTASGARKTTSSARRSERGGDNG